MSAGITEQEWKDRCAKRFVDRGGADWPTARGLADVCYEGLDGLDLDDESPEDAADEEMSNWTNDEGNTPD
jgi:hypothetical protein